MLPVRRAAARLQLMATGQPQNEVRLPFLPRQESDLSASDLDRLAAMLGGEAVCTPAGVPLAIEEALRKRHIFQPGAYFELRDVLDLRTEQKLIEETNAQRWALLPASGPPLLSESPETTQAFLGIPLPYRSKRTPYVSGLLLGEDLENNWHVVSHADGYLLYRRNW